MKIKINTDDIQSLMIDLETVYVGVKSTHDISMLELIKCDRIWVGAD
jgi:hypothetical protein